MSYLPSADDVVRAQAIVGGYSRSRLDIIGARPGNPAGVEIREVDGAVALMARRFAAPHFNCGYGFCDEQADQLPSVLDWYAQAGVTGRFELAPGRPIERTARLLAGAGYAQIGFHATFAGLPDLPDKPTEGVTITPVETASDLEAFSEAYHLGWGHTAFRLPVAPWLTAPGWSLSLARVDGAAAGAAVLYLRGRDAYLADGAVDPAFRRRGVHRALLDWRCAQASAAGAERIYSGADYLSSSSRNMLRKGLVQLYTEAVWSGPQPKGAG
jgi:ribosomal protein S18 acetylase RimI-like enzyme